MATFDLRTIDSETPPAWLALALTAEPYNQDSGKCRWRGTTDKPGALAEALDADDSVLEYEICATLRVGADTSHPSAEDMWADLGCSYSWDSSTDSGQVQHPVCTVEQIDTMTDRQILRVVAPGCCVDEALAYESMIGYAREALADMRGVETLLASAVRAYRAGDLQGCIDELDRAERAESDYGDAPATRALRGALIDE